MAKRFEDNPDNAPARQEEYKAELAMMTDAGLYEECGNKIWLSAYAANNPISCYHWQCDACWNESEKRKDGETEQSIYSRARREQVSRVR